jgi:hypothetical protein
MVVKLRTKRPDPILRQIVEALKEYDKAHPAAQIETYRQNAVSVRIRVIDPDFAGLGRAEREEELWTLFNRLPEDVVAEISLLLLLTPEEAKSSFANMEFDNPIPSRL